MKLLWVCNVILPKIANFLGMKESPVGGWLTGLSEGLQKNSDINLTVCFPAQKAISGKIPGEMVFYGFAKKGQKACFEKILKETRPDVVHIFGTEMGHTWTMIQACEKCGVLERTVVNIQGLVSVLARHYLEGLGVSAFFSPTFRSLFWGDSVLGAQRKFIKSGQAEILALKKVRHVIGRTDWDRACCLRVNPDLRYHFCNESLRNAFYEGERWSLEKCEKFSIFVSQCSYPIKGFHYMLEAMVDILRDYPEAHIYTTGRDLCHPSSLMDRLKMTSYQKYLVKLIRRYGLEDRITFLGSLGEYEMKERYLKSHVFVSASTCENSPNSVGEAMILGVPVVSSDVGGVKNLLEHGKCGWVYQSTAPYMLAYYVKTLFADSALAKSFSENAKIVAHRTHNREVNAQKTLEIYRQLAIRN